MAEPPGNNNGPLDPGVPAGASQRQQIREAAASWVSRGRLQPPVSVETLVHAAEEFLNLNSWPAEWLGFAMVCLNNALWRGAAAGVPPTKRLLLLPQCLRDVEKCRGEYDDYGFICGECGACAIHEIEKYAEGLGYTVLIAEATAAVEELIARGRFESVIGVSCLEALEKTIQKMVDRAIPGLAVPLLRNGCLNTAVDIAWLRETLGPAVAGQDSRPWLSLSDLVALQQRVKGWFTEAELQRLIGHRSQTERTAVDWVARDGKRWRPFLVAATAGAVSDMSLSPDSCRQLAVAVECFHKASLAHDDIEDGDTTRYGLPCLHVERGVPEALNVGDFLIGEGYRLAATGTGSPDTGARMVSLLADAQRSLCIGQGREFQLFSSGRAPSVRDVEDLFELKTVPAFEAALALGALAGGADRQTMAVLREFSRAVGVAYQIRDDLEDLKAADPDSAQSLACSILVAKMLEEDSTGEYSSLFPFTSPPARALVVSAVRESGAIQWARQRIDALRAEAQRAAEATQMLRLRQLLFRVAGRLTERYPTA